MNAKEYKKLAAKKRLTTDIYDLQLPSGAIWKLRKPPIEQFIMAGKLPTALVARMAKAAKKDAEATDVMRDLSADEMVASLEFGRDLLLYCAVEPAIALNPKGENEIAPEDILPDDFLFLINWLITGGRAGESLNTFPAK